MLTRSRHARRGSAIILAILTVLILTIIGIGVIYFMQIEDRVSGNAQLYRRGFYAAEAGIKVGEKKLNTAYQASDLPYFFNTLLTSTPLYSPPGGGAAAHPLTLSGITYTNVYVDPSDPTQGYYSLYVRNDNEDPSEVDTNATINLVSVGRVAAGLSDGSGNPVYLERVLEEQITIPNAQVKNPPTQTGGGPGGTGSVAIGSS